VNVASFAIWINALSALVEASIKLSPASVSDASTLRSRLQTLVSGEMQVVIGNPIITFFGHEAHGDGGKDLVTQRVFENGTENSWGLYSLNTSKALESVQPAAENSLEVDAWIDLVNWATEQPDSLQVPEGQHDEAGKPAHTQPENVAEESTGMDESFEETTSSSPEVENAPNISSPEIEGAKNGSTEEVEQDGTETTVETEPVVETKMLSPEELASNSWPSTDGVRVQVGSKLNTIGEAVIDYWPGNTELTQMNFGVVGNLGTGKTQFLLSVITQLRLSAQRTQANPLNFLVFDYKSDYQKPEFLTKVNGQVLKPDNGIPLNVLAIRGEYSRIAAVKKAESFCDVISKIYANVGPVQKEALIDTIVDLFEDSPTHQAPPLSKVLASYKQNTGKDSDAVTSVLNKFVRRRTFIENPDEVKSFEELIEDKVLVVSLSDFGADHESKNTLVVLFLDLYYDYMKFSKKWDFEGLEPQIRKLNSYLLVDEATNIMQYEFQILKNLLLEGREYGFGTILASQYLSHFRTPSINYAETLNTWMIHQVPSVTAKQLRDLGIPEATEVSAKNITEFKLHEGFYASLGNRGINILGLPFYKLFEK